MTIRSAKPFGRPSIKSVGMSVIKSVRRRKPSDWLRLSAVWGAAAATVSLLAYIVGFIVVKGVPHIRPSLFAAEYTVENQSLYPALVTTVIMVGLTLAIAVPLGMATAVYLVEYARRGGRLVRVIRVTAETLAGIPSIVYGLFGYIFFATWLGLGKSILTGCLTLSIMILPLIMRTTEESLKSVPDGYREGSFSLGAGRLRTVWRVTLPSAAPGIFAGV
ncbi:MAG: ABC transporter permease subunit, partial [Oscillospiraceae bacterium]|nr:ABC transporter permease subunit [Oscillospiraceae bacterium]